MNYVDKEFEGERSLFKETGSELHNCRFLFGESPLKESRDVKIFDSIFEWKYPMWYSKNIYAKNITLLENARSGIWYTQNIEIYNSLIHAPKTFRRSKNIKLVNVTMDLASESFWNCKDISLKDVNVNGDYFMMNCKNAVINNMHLNGNYFFDGGENLLILNSVLDSKDAIWNAKNVTLKNCKINGEYIGWNSKNITFIDCEISSHQGFCYMKNVKLVNCKIIDSDLCFEFSKNIDADINNVVDSIKNPSSGIINVKGIKNLILDGTVIDPKQTTIIYKKDEI